MNGMGLRFRVQGLGLRVQGLGIRVLFDGQFLGFRVGGDLPCPHIIDRSNLFGPTSNLA